MPPPGGSRYRPAPGSARTRGRPGPLRFDRPREIHANRIVGRSPAVDRREIEDLYRRFGPLVRRRARGLLGKDDEAEDAMQEVFARAIHSIADFRRQSQPSTWLYRITTNLCLNRIRDYARRRDRLAQAHLDERLPLPSAPVRANPEARVLVRRLLGEMPEDLARVAVYYYVDELDQAEIAVLLQVSRRTIGYRLDRFRELAEALLERPGFAAAPAPGVPKAEGESG